ncbi:unnamed protein product [Rotaria sp. Silwood1]|nr:unnamed protein product [Rotaria sp. Silwood1]CAF1128230.1 unnamed protein product [Rotaria sp. Silwood1]CAF3439263.1 unnamed protein product [Rotaria sp. Silwood1]CAF3461507.1 unnamed protein product [Rotaria sp. Silwood1]CAF3466851.1 unnamed protein product [Rotaria sp. Silwood1]
MNSSKSSLIEYLKAIESERFEDAVKILDDIIKDIPDAEKDSLIVCLKFRICALYKIKNYTLIILDCLKLEQLGIDIDNDLELSTIKM